MDPEINNRLIALEEKIDSIWKSVEKTRKYFLITMWSTVVVVVLPLILMLFAIPAMINNLSVIL